MIAAITGSETNRIAFRLQVRPEMIDEYRVAPHGGVAGDARRTQSLRLASLLAVPRPRRHAVRILRVGGSLADAVAAMQREPVNDRWQAMMAPYFEHRRRAAAAADQQMQPLEEVFHLP